MNNLISLTIYYRNKMGMSKSKFAEAIDVPAKKVNRIEGFGADKRLDISQQHKEINDYFEKCKKGFDVWKIKEIDRLEKTLNSLKDTVNRIENDILILKHSK